MSGCWNIGKMGFSLRLVQLMARRGHWTVGLMPIIVYTIKLKMDNIPLLTTIPPFHYSIIEAKTQLSENLLYFQFVIEISRCSIITIF